MRNDSEKNRPIELTPSSPWSIHSITPLDDGYLLVQFIDELQGIAIKQTGKYVL